MTFIERITELRREKGVSEKQVLLDCGLSKNSFGNWKKGITPLVSAQNVLASYFGVSVEYLMGLTDIKKEPITDEDDGLSQEFKSLYCQLTPEQREIVIAAMRDFAREK